MYNTRVQPSVINRCERNHICWCIQPKANVREAFKSKPLAGSKLLTLNATPHALTYHQSLWRYTYYLHPLHHWISVKLLMEIDGCYLPHKWFLLFIRTSGLENKNTFYLPSLICKYYVHTDLLVSVLFCNFLNQPQWLWN